MILLLITAAAAIAGLVMGIGQLLAMPKTPDPQKGNANFSGPRSNYGEPIPYIFGTVQIESPICIYAGDVFQGSPFYNWPSKGREFETELVFNDTDLGTEQYNFTMDLLLAERMHVNGQPVGTVTLRKIWYGQNLLWDGSGFSTKVTGSGTLLEWDPYRGSTLNLPGGVSSVWERGGGWWYGGISNRTPGGDGGEVLGWWNAVRDNDGNYTQGFGLESVRFYVGNGDELENEWIGTDLFGDLWQTEPQFHYHKYNKFIRLVFEDFFWGLQPSIDQISCELTVSCPAFAIGDFSGLMPNGLDVNPVSVLYQLLSNPEFSGGTKLPTIDIASFTEARQIAADEGLGMSYRLQAAIKASDLVETILTHIDGALFREPTTGVLSLKLNRFAPDSSVLPTFSEAVIVGISNFAKSTWTSAYSQVRLGFEHRGSAPNGMYAKNVAVAKDTGLAAMSGAVEVIDEESATAFTPEVANSLANRKMAGANVPLVKMDIKFTREMEGGFSPMDLRPLSMFNLKYGPYGIANVTMRVLKIDLGTLADNTISVTAIQDRYVPPVLTAPPEVTDAPEKTPPVPVSITGYAIETAPYFLARMGLGADAKRILTSFKFEADITGNYLNEADWLNSFTGYNYDRFLILAKRPSRTASFMAKVVNSDTGSTEDLLGSVPYTPCGILATSIPTAETGFGGEPVSFVVTEVSKDEIAHLGQSRTPGDYAINPKNVVLINGEFLCLVQYSHNASSRVLTVTHAQRVLLDSDWSRSAHAVDDLVWFLDFTDEPLCIRKMTRPIISNRPYLVPASYLGASEFALPYNADYGTAGMPRERFQVTLQPIGNQTTGSNTVVSAALHDRANRLMAPRQISFGTSNSVIPTGYGFNPMDGSQIGGKYGINSFNVDFAPGDENLNTTGDSTEKADQKALEIEQGYHNPRDSVLRPFHPLTFPGTGVRFGENLDAHQLIPGMPEDYLSNYTNFSFDVAYKKNSGSLSHATTMNSRNRTLSGFSSDLTPFTLRMYIRSFIGVYWGETNYMAQMSRPRVKMLPMNRHPAD